MDRRLEARRDDDLIESSPLPWWVKAIGVVGVPSAIAIYLVWTIASGLVPAMAEMQKTLNAVAADHIVSKSQNDNILRVLRASCVNQAQTNDARERCLQ